MKNFCKAGRCRTGWSGRAVLLALLLICLLALPKNVSGPLSAVFDSPGRNGAVYAADNVKGQHYLFDEAGLLDEDEQKLLSQRAGEISEQYQSGVYILLVKDFEAESSGEFGDILDFARSFYQSRGLGYGGGQEGLLLCISMAARDQCVLSHGARTNAVMDEAGRSALQEAFLGALSEDDWFDGLKAYQEEAAWLWHSEQTGEVPAGAGGGFRETAPSSGEKPLQSLREFLVDCLIGLAVSLPIAFIVCEKMRRQMNTALSASEAGDYIDESSVNIRKREEVLMHTSVSRKPIGESESDRGNGGGGGGHSVSHRHIRERGMRSMGSMSQGRKDSGGYSGSRGKF